MKKEHIFKGLAILFVNIVTIYASRYYFMDPIFFSKPLKLSIAHPIWLLPPTILASIVIYLYANDYLKSQQKTSGFISGITLVMSAILGVMTYVYIIPNGLTFLFTLI